MRPIRKAVITAAGYGTRFLPATKNQPKEMLPIVDKPIIQYLVEEAVNSGIKDIIIVTRAGTSVVEDHFDSQVELEYNLKANGKLKRLEEVQKIPQMANFIYVRQKKNLPYGNASPLLAAQHLIDDDEAFVYMFGDDLVQSEIPATKQLIGFFLKHKPAAVLAVQETPWEEVYRYGTVRYKKNTSCYQIEEILEKLSQEKAPSNMCQFGRFVFSYKVLEEVKKTPLGKGEELWIADVLNQLAKKSKVLATPVKGQWMTTGDPLNYLKAMVYFALDRKDIGQDFENFLKGLQN